MQTKSLKNVLSRHKVKAMLRRLFAGCLHAFYLLSLFSAIVSVSVVLSHMNRCGSNPRYRNYIKKQASKHSVSTLTKYIMDKIHRFVRIISFDAFCCFFNLPEWHSTLLRLCQPSLTEWKKNSTKLNDWLKYSHIPTTDSNQRLSVSLSKIVYISLRMARC